MVAAISTATIRFYCHSEKFYCHWQQKNKILLLPRQQKNKIILLPRQQKNKKVLLPRQQKLFISQSKFSKMYQPIKKDEVLYKQDESTQSISFDHMKCSKYQRKYNQIFSNIPIRSFRLAVKKFPLPRQQNYFIFLLPRQQK